MKTLLSACAFFLFISASPARFVEIWPYDKMKESADLIVIATPTAVKVTDERAKVLNTVAVEGLETTFEVIAVLKGDNATKRIVFHHYQEAGKVGIQINGPLLISFRPAEHKKYLLFLKREADGRFASITGQADPGDGVKDLGGTSIDTR